MASHRLTIASVFVFLTFGVAQVGQGDDTWRALIQIDNILRSAHVSGSVAYSSCGFHQRLPDSMTIRFLSDYSGQPREVLEKMFADNPRMRVTQEPGGMIRMMETDVPTDLLAVKIHHLKFDSGPMSRGPNMALIAILRTPEVIAFRRANSIGPFEQYINGGGFALPGNCCGPGRSMSGELEDVTMAQALDHVLQTFPGFWIYENCLSKEGDRSVYFAFVDVRP